MTSNHSSRFVDHNAAVQVGMRIDGTFTHKLETAMVVSFKLDGKPCSGVLHVSQFPSEERAMRDQMFGVATIGMPAPGLTVIGVEPPSGDKRYTRVRLTSRPLKDNAKSGKQNGAQANNGGKRQSHSRREAATTSGAASSALSAPVANCIVATSVTPPVVAVSAPIDPVARARQLSVEARQPARSVGLADLGRALAISRLGGDTTASSMLGSIESTLSSIDAFAAEAKRISSSLDDDTMSKASTLSAIRAEKRDLDAATAAVRKESALYAGLCGKVKRAGDNAAELQAKADEMKTAVEAKRASLKESYAANKKADDDADLALLFSLNAPDIKAAMEQALEIAGNLAAVVARRDQLITELAKLNASYEKRLG
ncbi:MAG: hypothetical protein SGJ27_27945 [Candidatus Melainabacteria bacterium]|nr:hypothetical protein [Candidatus Melainabacteria bacterium]